MLRKNKINSFIINSIALLSTITYGCSKNEHFNEGLKLYEKYDYVKANKLFDLAIHNNESENEKLFFYKGVCLVELDSANKAITYFKKALKEDESKSNTAITLSHLGDAYNRIDNNNEAFKAFLLASILNPRLKQVNTNIGISLYNMDRCKESVSYLKKDYSSDSYSNKTLLVLSAAYTCLSIPDSARYFQYLAKHQH